MRLANESGPLSMVFLRSKESILVDLCDLYQSLKRIEDQRGIEVFYGVGVLPKSRRILLGVICNLQKCPLLSLILIAIFSTRFLPILANLLHQN